MTTDVVIVGGGPNGLLMACELALCGVQPVVLERLLEPDTLPKANGLVGRVVQALDYRCTSRGCSADPARRLRRLGEWARHARCVKRTPACTPHLVRRPDANGGANCYVVAG
jgi:2-polyprenyl-6-methoxyphenol hydroxylase-like FAD-dependent oxidoreductase